MDFSDTANLTTRRHHGIRLVVLVSESQSVKYAYRMMKAFFNKALDEIHMITAINLEENRTAALIRQKEVTEPELRGCTFHHVVTKEDDYSLYESLGRYVAGLHPHLLFMGSNSLCVGPRPAAARTSLGSPASPSWSSTPLAAPSLSAHQLSLSLPPAASSPAASFVASMALRLLPELRCCPVMLVKYNSRGAWLGANANAAAIGGPEGGGGGAMRIMVDLQANSRHVLEWLFEHFTAGRDHLTLTVSQAFDEKGNQKQTAQRLLTAFGVQAAVNAFSADKTMLAGPANRSLPQAVADAEPDVLVVQAPRCRGLPAPLQELLQTAKTSFLIWPPEYSPAQ